MQLFITCKFSTKGFVEQTIELTGWEIHWQGKVNDFNKVNRKNFNEDFSMMDFSQGTSSITSNKSPHFRRMKLTLNCLSFSLSSFVFLGLSSICSQSKSFYRYSFGLRSFDFTELAPLSYSYRKGLLVIQLFFCHHS